MKVYKCKYLHEDGSCVNPSTALNWETCPMYKISGDGYKSCNNIKIDWIEEITLTKDLVRIK